MASKDSEIIDLKEQDLKNNSDEVFELIHATSHSILYRMRRDGKYFIAKQSAANDENGRKILRREYEISTGLSHPNIVDIYEYRYGENYQDSIIMEYIEGRTLNDFLADSPSFKIRKRIFSELLDAIDYLHRQRIIHNDIKPENIIISTTGNRVKLIDVGLSDDDVHYAFKSIGYTKGYSAPELIDERKSDVRSDIYSLGVLMKLMFGNRYHGIIKKCTAKTPEKRFPDVKSLSKSWERSHLKWLIPLIAAVALIIGIGVWQTIEFQKQRLSNLEQTISTQSKALEDQAISNRQLSESYSNVKDSLDMMIKNLSIHEELKKNKLADFRKKIISLSSKALDSIKICTDVQQDFNVRYNFQSMVTRLYDMEDKTVEGEDLSAQLHSLMFIEVEKAFNEFNAASPFYQSFTKPQ